MIYKETEQLIAKYLNGETTLEEEKQLALEVSRPDAPPEWQAVAAMLGELTIDEALFDNIMAQRAAEKKRRKANIIRWAVAASLLLIVGFGAVLSYQKNDIAPNMPIVAQVQEKPQQKHANVERKSESEQKDITVKPKIVTPAQIDKVAVEKEELKKKETKSVSLEADISQKIDSSINEPEVMVSEPEVVLVSSEYQDPNLMNGFIAEMAKVCNADSIDLDCKPTDDKNSIIAVYIFQDDKRTDVFGRLLQAACWYDSGLPGYRLNLSSRQFFFELKDMQMGTHYMWIAERIRGNILLHCARATQGKPIPSQCYRKFRTEYEGTYIF